MKRYELVNTPIQRLFDNFFEPAFQAPRFLDSPARNWAHFEVKELEKGFVVQAELAGVKKDDLKIEVIGDTLKVSGSRGSKEAKDGFLEYAEFTRSFTLGKEIDTDKIEAKFENGFLNLVIPRAEEVTKTRLIDVK